MKPIIIDLPADGRLHYRAVITPGNPVTICEIQRQSEPVNARHWEIKYYGMSICRPGDTYDLETGCRLSLKSALRKPKNYDYCDRQNVRAAVWKAYLDLFPPDKRKKIPLVKITIGPDNMSNEELKRIKARLQEAIEKALKERMERSLFGPRAWSSGPFNGNVTWGIDHAKVQS